MRIKRVFRPILAGAALGLMLSFPQSSMDAARNALLLFSKSVLPALFPFTACMLLLTAGRSFSLFPLLIFAYLGGSPAGARLFADARLSPARAQRIARATGLMSPLFFTGTLSAWLNDPKAALLLLFCHYAGGMLLLFPLSKGDKEKIALPPLSVGSALQQSALAMLSVAGCVTLGSVGARLLSCALPFLPRLPLALLQSVFEVTSGSKSLISLSPPLLLPLLSFFTGMNGFSILLQNAVCWGKHGISLSDLLFYGILRGIISFLICFMILLCHPAYFAV
ncbi:MAG: hypothetical protein IKW00_02055 [Clostridia bacterium]|nr:hypothetical protein [Clostridia bacterium]